MEYQLTTAAPYANKLHVQVVWVPGSFEIPLVAKATAKSGKFDAILTIGAVVGHSPCTANFVVTVRYMLFFVVCPLQSGTQCLCHRDSQLQGWGWREMLKRGMTSKGCLPGCASHFRSHTKVISVIQWPQVRGATTHYEAVVNSATGGSLSASLESGVPVIFGVLTTENMEQVC